MTTIHADKIDIEVGASRWVLFEGDEGGSISPLFEYTRGDNVMYYQSRYGRSVGLPGDKLSADYVRAVMVGYHEPSRRWLLGLHLAQSEDAKPVFKCLVRWQESQSQTHIDDVRRAARALSVFMGCPLKIFGEKKLPSRASDAERSGVTGPLEPHGRHTIEYAEVERTARDIDLPIEGGGFFSVTKAQHGLLLRLNKDMEARGDENPAYNLCEINTHHKKVKLIPPTGLLGVFTRAHGQEIPFDRVQNVEFRYIKEEISQSVPSEDRTFIVEQFSYRHVWRIYLTLRDESLLVLSASFNQSSALLQSRITMVGGTKLETNSLAGVQYFRQHMAEQEKIDHLQTAVEHTAYLMAYLLDRHLVKTEVQV